LNIKLRWNEEIGVFIEIIHDKAQKPHLDRKISTLLKKNPLKMSGF
jgi:hypothetical protein